MIRIRTIRRWFAWLALVAIGLSVVAPVVSQTLAGMASASSDVICAEHGDQTPESPPPAPHHPAGMQHCGYCGLLAHSPAPARVVWHANATHPRTQPVSARPHASVRPARWALQAAPRGPPVFAHA
ncbi:MAG: DUF2946 domain-containing protein [Rhodanobacter sp.]